jgi:phosphoglycerol transferase MdoB-like AlkP superfamily enzyme
MTRTLINKIKKLNFFRTFLISQILTRIILSSYAIVTKQIGILHLPLIFTLGLFNDIITGIYLIPIIVILSLLFKVVIKKPNSKYYTTLISYGFFCLLLVFTMIAEIAFWDEYGTKFNFIAVDYLIYTQEIIGTLKDSLPIKPVIAGMALITILITYLMRRKLKRASNELDRSNNLLLIGLSIILAWGFNKIYNSNYTAFSNNRYANELALNGPYEFIKAFMNNALDYNKFYTTLPSREALDIARREVLQNHQAYIDNKTLQREITSLQAEKKYNVILITVESLSAEFINHYGGKENITPNIDKLIPQSLVFNNIYAVGTRTVRGLEALTLSMPPTPGSSVIRRPNNDNLFNIGTIFNEKNYDVKFVFGGYSYFDNLSNYFGKNQFQILDRSDLRIEEISFSNVWGVADEDILKKALEAGDNSYKAKKPFFQLIMTTSNHRPYTFPNNRIDLPSGSGRAAAVKYTDYAIGQFLELAKTKPWFDNTIFVITADHCASSAGKTELPIHKYHIPLLIYAPKLVKAGVNNSLASQIDIPPTLLGMLNFNYKSKFFGKDILKSSPNRAFVSTYQLLGYMKDSNLIMLSPNKTPEQFQIDGKKLIKAAVSQDLLKEAISHYQTAYELYNDGALKNK